MESLPTAPMVSLPIGAAVPLAGRPIPGELVAAGVAGCIVWLMAGFVGAGDGSPPETRPMADPAAAPSTTTVMPNPRVKYLNSPIYAHLDAQSDVRAITAGITYGRRLPRGASRVQACQPDGGACIPCRGAVATRARLTGFGARPVRCRRTGR